MEEYQQIFHKNKRYASDFYQASSNVECSLSLLCIFIFRICFHGTALAFVDVLPCPRIFLFTFPPPPLFPCRADIDEFIREALPCRKLAFAFTSPFHCKSFQSFVRKILFQHYLLSMLNNEILL